MRCFKARQKLNELKFDKTAIADNQDLLNHLRECHECAALLSSEQILKRDLETAAVDDNEEVVSWWLLKSQVESKATSQTRTQFREKPLMAFFSKLFNKPRLGIGISAVVVVLILSALIPFSYNKTIGYEVAFAGVDRDLAMDEFKIQELLTKLGIDGADIDVTSCEEFCNVTITDLKTTDDAQLVKAAFNKIDNVELLEDIHEVIENESCNIYEKIIVKLTNGDRDLTFISNDTVDHVLIERLGNNPEEQILIWRTTDTSLCDSLFVNQDNGDSVCSYFNILDCDLTAVEDNDGNLTITINKGTHDEQIIELPNGKIDDNTRALLEELGLSVSIMTLEDGSRHAMLTNASRVFLNKDGSASGQTDSKSITILKTDYGSKGIDADATDPTASAKVSELPEGFALHQNYPNPFNPTTTIRFNIPAAQHVTIEIINMNGQKVKTLFEKEIAAGEYTIDWDATNENGQKVASGMYLYKLSTPTDVAVKKMTLLK